MKTKERTNAMRRAARALRKGKGGKEKQEVAWEFVEGGFEDRGYIAVSQIFEPHEDGTTGYEPGNWFWCMHCERAYPSGSFKRDKKNGLLLCPYPDCSGDIVFDARGWDMLLECNSENPVIPERGTVYPLYGHGTK